MASCGVFWGSHGCDLPVGHDGQHVCSCCPGEPGHTTASSTDRVEDVDGVACVGTWPYYGPDTVFFRLDDLGIEGEFARLEGIRRA